MRKKSLSSNGKVVGHCYIKYKSLVFRLKLNTKVHYKRVIRNTGFCVSDLLTWLPLSRFL